jgi:hypothetical protein
VGVDPANGRKRFGDGRAPAPLAQDGGGAGYADGDPRHGLHRVQRESGGECGPQGHAVGMEGERGGPAGDADVRRRERDDAGELERGHDEERRGQRVRDAERGAGERGGGDARGDRAGDPGGERGEAARSCAA